jgi:hypothetical protein
MFLYLLFLILSIEDIYEFSIYLLVLEIIIQSFNKPTYRLLNNHIRYQKGFNLNHLFPPIPGFCACGCNRPLKGKQKKWASRDCNNRVYLEFAILKGNTGIIRKTLLLRDSGFCRKCGVFDENWEADHIVPVYNGGGACTIDNFQTLCPSCHIEKTIFQTESQRATISSQEHSSRSKVLL